MKKKYLGYYSLIILFSVLFITCKKQEKNNTSACGSNELTSRVINNKPATIKQLATGLFIIIEQGTIDVTLNPCNLSNEFKIDNLNVKISGEVKNTPQIGPAPCCTNNFVITAITR